MIKQYKSLKQQFLYAECLSFPFTNVRMYVNKNGRCDLYAVDGYGTCFEMKYDVKLDTAKKTFRKMIKKYIDVPKT